MRLDHIAYRVKDRFKTAEFFINCFGYRLEPELPDGFKIDFEDGSSAKCLVLLPPERMSDDAPWKHLQMTGSSQQVYHLPPELFVSDGSPDSVVGKWVAARDGVGGIHHLAYQVDSVRETMKEWQQKGYAEFTTDDPLTCPGLTQVFTKPSALTGVIYEFIEREAQGFCQDNVKDLMESTKDLS